MIGSKIVFHIVNNSFCLLFQWTCFEKTVHRISVVSFVELPKLLYKLNSEGPSLADGGCFPKCLYALEVASLPRGVRFIKPS